MAEPTLANTEFIVSLKVSVLTDNQKSLLNDLLRSGVAHDVVARAVEVNVSVVEHYALNIFAEPQENQEERMDPRLKAYINQMIKQSHDRLKEELKNEIAEQCAAQRAQPEPEVR